MGFAWKGNLAGFCLGARLGVGIHRVAGTNEVPIAVHVVDAADRWPELVLTEIGQRKRRLFAAVGVWPIVTTNRLARVWRVFEWIVMGIQRPADDGGNLAVDGNHRITETV